MKISLAAFWKSKIHPKIKMKTLNEDKISELFYSVKSILNEMAEKGGRDTEKDIFGVAGGYKTVMSSNNVGMHCSVCGELEDKKIYKVATSDYLHEQNDEEVNVG